MESKDEGAQKDNPEEKGFSVIIPVRNKKNHLNRCLNSVLRQTFTRIEVLVVDDESSDGSLAIARSYQKKDDRIRIFQRDTPGPGGYAARNLGLQQASYDWCAFLDADDEWQEDHLEVTGRLIQRYPNTVLITSSWIIDDGHDQILDDYSRATNSDTPRRLTLDDYLEGPRPIWTGVVRAKTSFLREVGFFDERWRHGADTEYWFRLFLKGGGGILWVPGPTAIYHTDSDNMVTADTSQTLSPTSELIHRLLRDDTVDSYRTRKLKQFANRSQMRPFIRHAAFGNPVLPYAREHFFLRELTLQQSILIGMLTLMPKRLSKLVAGRFLNRNASIN